MTGALPLPLDTLASAEAEFKAAAARLEDSAAPPDAVSRVEEIIVTATRQHAGWGKLTIVALRVLGLYLLRNPYRGMGKGGRPPKTVRADSLPTLAERGVSDRHIAPRALAVARISEADWNAYIASGGTSERGLHKFVQPRPSSVPTEHPERETENYSESECVNVVHGRTDTRAANASTERPYSWRSPSATGRSPTPMPEPQGPLADLVGRVTQGDCLQVMRRIPDKIIKGIITSPQYNLRNSTGGGMHNGRGGKWPNAALLQGYDDHDDKTDHQEYVTLQREYLSEMIRVLRNDGAIFYNHKRRVQDGKLQDPAEIVKGLALPVRQIIIWKRSGGINFNPGYFLPTYELIYLIAGPHFKIENGCHKYSDVWEISQERDNPHPAPFPLELPLRCIESIGEGIILDPFLGSGTTAMRR
jgi:site-specific DNA-methyltransferase (adenine-specific)